MDSFYEKTLQTKTLYEGKVIQVDIEEVALPNGKTSTRELVRHPGAVAVIVYTDEGKLVLVEQYRKALEKTLIEIPAGKMEKGEAPLHTAERELVEETGYTADALEYIGSFYTSPGFADECVYLYEAQGVVKGEQNLDEDEFVNVIEVTLEEAEALMAKEKIHDAKTCYAVQYLKMKKMQHRLT
ncbi:NUDIX hydrolase [Bacillus sp. FSL W7-1360]